jgi:hypothetical protein
MVMLKPTGFDTLLPMILGAVLVCACGGDDSERTLLTPSVPPYSTAITLSRGSPSPGAVAPSGYGQSCAAAHPWGVQVRAPFVCIDEPTAGYSTPRGSPLLVRGYAGGSFENNVIIELRIVAADGGLPPGMLARIPLTYAAPDAGMPGAWRTTINLPASGLPSTVRVLAYIESPRDGSRVAEATVDIRLR